MARNTWYVILLTCVKPPLSLPSPATHLQSLWHHAQLSGYVDFSSFCPFEKIFVREFSCACDSTAAIGYRFLIMFLKTSLKTLNIGRRLGSCLMKKALPLLHKLCGCTHFVHRTSLSSPDLHLWNKTLKMCEALCKHRHLRLILDSHLIVECRGFEVAPVEMNDERLYFFTTLADHIRRLVNEVKARGRTSYVEDSRRAWLLTDRMTLSVQPNMGVAIVDSTAKLPLPDDGAAGYVVTTLRDWSVRSPLTSVCR